MSKFVKGDEVILLRNLISYQGPDISAGTRGTISSIEIDITTVYYVNFDDLGVHRVREDGLSLASSAITPRTFNIASSIKDVIYNDPATIIFWKDGTKSVVKCDGEEYDPEKGFAMAVCKKVFGNEGNYYNTFKKWPPEEAEFEVGKVFKLSKEMYGLPVGTLVRITSINKKTGKVSLICKNFKGEFTTNKKYLKPF